MDNVIKNDVAKANEIINLDRQCKKYIYGNESSFFDVCGIFPMIFCLFLELNFTYIKIGVVLALFILSIVLFATAEKYISALLPIPLFIIIYYTPLELFNSKKIFILFFILIEIAIFIFQGIFSKNNKDCKKANNIHKRNNKKYSELVSELNSKYKKSNEFTWWESELLYKEDIKNSFRSEWVNELEEPGRRTTRTKVDSTYEIYLQDVEPEKFSAVVEDLKNSTLVFGSKSINDITPEDRVSKIVIRSKSLTTKTVNQVVVSEPSVNEIEAYKEQVNSDKDFFEILSNSSYKTDKENYYDAMYSGNYSSEQLNELMRKDMESDIYRNNMVNHYIDKNTHVSIDENESESYSDYFINKSLGYVIGDTLFYFGNVEKTFSDVENKDDIFNAVSTVYASLPGPKWYMRRNIFNTYNDLRKAALAYRIAYLNGV